MDEPSAKRAKVQNTLEDFFSRADQGERRTIMSREAVQSQSKEYVASMLSKLSRGGDVSRDEAAMAYQYYNAILLELDSASFFLDLNTSTERSQNPHEKITNEFQTLHHQHEKLKKAHEELETDHKALGKELDCLRKKDSLEGKAMVESNEKKNQEYITLQREYEQLKKDNDVLRKEFDSYKTKQEGKFTVVYLEKGCNTDTFQKDYTAYQRELQELRRDKNNMIKELQYFRNKEEHNVKHQSKGNDMGHTEKEHTSLQRENEQLKKDNDILNNEIDSYKTKQQTKSTVVHLEKGCNTDTFQKDYTAYQRELQELRRDKDNMIKELQYLRNKEEQNVKHQSKGNDMGHTEKEHTTLQRENEQLKKDNDILNNELDSYKTKQQAKSTVVHLEKGCNTGQDPGQSKAMEKLRQQNQQLIEEKDKFTAQINELRNRLSMIAGHKLTAGNPDIADLSDAYRPTNIAEQFRQLYDDEWTPAFEELAQNFTDDEVEIIDVLAKIIKDVDHFCSEAQLQQFEHLKYHAIKEILEPLHQAHEAEKRLPKSDSPDEMSKTQEDLVDKLLKDFRKSLGILSKTSLKKMFHKAHMSHFTWKNKTVPSSNSLNDFAGRTLELVWMMKLQDPPMELAWCNIGDRFNKNMFSHYTKRGNIVTQCVWPAVLLHKDGPLMSKGVVQGN